MVFDKALKVTVIDGGQAVTEVTVESGRALVGSGGHCDLRLAPDKVAVEHLLLEAQPGGLFAEARAALPQVTIDGAPFQSGRILAGSQLRVGRLVIRVETISGRDKPVSQARVRPRFLFLGALMVPIAAWATLGRSRAINDEVFKPAPALFAPVSATCPEGNYESTRAELDAWYREALGRHEQSPFSPRDGIEAVRLYRQSAQCLLRQRRTSEAGALELEADGLAQRLERDFHVHRVRLARALTGNDAAGARHEVRLLRGYFSEHSGEFALWLDYLDRKLGLQASSKKVKGIIR